MNRGRTWTASDRIPGLIVERLQAAHPADEDHVFYRIGDEHGPDRIQLDTAPAGQPTFHIENGGRRQTADVCDAIDIIASYLEQSRRGGQAFFAPMVEQCPPMSENPWWHPTQDDLDWDDPLPSVIVLSPEYGAELPLRAEPRGHIDWRFTKFPPELLDRLAAWQEEFDESYDYETGWRSDAARDRWAHDAKDLAADLRAAMGTRAELVVNLWPLGE